MVDQILLRKPRSSNTNQFCNELYIGRIKLNLAALLWENIWYEIVHMLKIINAVIYFFYCTLLGHKAMTLNDYCIIFVI